LFVIWFLGNYLKLFKNLLIKDKQGEKKYMSTNNFYYKNSKFVYAVEIENEFDYDDLIINIQHDKRLRKGNNADYWEKNGLRSYDGKVIKTIEKTKNNWHLTFEIIVRNGYYAGVNIDWDVKILFDGYDRDKAGEYDLGDKTIPRYINDIINKQIDKIEAILKDYTMPLSHVATFSNGEAVYEKAKINN
jgi:hypothetical protein